MVYTKAYTYTFFYFSNIWFYLLWSTVIVSYIESDPICEQAHKNIVDASVLTSTPESSLSSAMEPMATISSPSSLTHIGIGVPQKRFREIAQSFAPSSLVYVYTYDEKRKQKRRNKTSRTQTAPPLIAT